jgi:hypothetical protein
MLEAAIDRPGEHVPADLCLRHLASAGHVVLGPAGEQHVVFRDADAAVQLRLYGFRPLLSPMTTTFLLRGLPDPQGVSAALSLFTGLILHPNNSRHESREPLLMREALVALDGRCAGASYQEMAAVLYGAEEARAAWSSLSRAMKDRMCRALRKGQRLRDGSYRKLLQ